MMQNDDLEKELKIRGLSQTEAEELGQVAKSIGQIGRFARSEEVKEQFLVKLLGTKKQELFAWPRLFAPAVAFVLILVVLGAGSVVFAQKSLPGDFLYPVKRLSENVAVSLNPELEQEIVVRRSQEVKDLVEQKEDPGLVKDTLDDFSEDSQKAKSEGHANGNIEEGVRNLEEAKERSSDDEKKQIEETLKKLEEQKDNNEGSVKGSKSEEKKRGRNGSSNNSAKDNENNSRDED